MGQAEFFNSRCRQQRLAFGQVHVAVDVNVNEQ